jgi:hypothetical protein
LVALIVVGILVLKLFVSWILFPVAQIFESKEI